MGGEAAHRHLVPQGARGAPILLRVRLNATELTTHPTARTSAQPRGYDNATDVIVEGGYIRVVQDIRGKYDLEGDYVMNPPCTAPHPTPVDHATDTYDTIDWLVKNVPRRTAGSHPGHLLRRLPAPDGARRPASRAQGAVPMNPMSTGGWRRLFHNGAFRQQGMP